MTDELEPDIQYELAYAAQDLDRVEAALRKAGHAPLADELFRLQQDNGLDRVSSVAETADGEQTAALIEQYEGNVPARLARVLRECHAAVAEPELKDFLTGLMGTLKIAPQAPAAAPPPPAP